MIYWLSMDVVQRLMCILDFADVILNRSQVEIVNHEDIASKHHSLPKHRALVKRAGLERAVPRMMSRTKPFTLEGQTVRCYKATQLLGKTAAGNLPQSHENSCL